MTKRIGIAAVFLVGCAVGGGASQLVVPKATAQQAATLTRWETMCRDFPREDADEHAVQLARLGNAAGDQGWELIGSDVWGVWCFKRPKM